MSNGKLGRDAELMSALYMGKVLWERPEPVSVSWALLRKVVSNL